MIKCKQLLLPTSAALLVWFVGSGCATQERVLSQRYLQRPLRVAIVPGVNKTDQPEANIVFDKAWEEALTKRGYQVIPADQVVSYGGSTGQSLADIRRLTVQKLGQDLKVDAILETEILRWKNSYKVLAADTTVSGLGRLVETSTGATIWEHYWVFQEKSNNGGNNGLVGMLVDAAVTAAINSATDRPTRLAKMGVNMSVGTTPVPGNAPQH